MKFIKKLYITIIMIVFLSGFNILMIPEHEVLTSSVQAASIKINTKKKTLKVKQTCTLKISGTKKKVKWTSSNKKVATVSSKGKVTAKKKGTATITAKVGNKKYTCKITVTNPTSSKTVYITRAGSKYHRSGCIYLNRSKIKIDYSKAKKQGYTACKVCKP